ncbi:SH3 domain-containing protein [Streptomyces lacrimifluminis]|uniref:SH3b domain-containing protein n=1 Tax=Streptomyces lacrimifluminis TaxID=1500077 RepID=A0A917NVZ9_9ACTN|nr:SH3 domain-containing protein [Streptomyces lacrimifluminis]GGJ33873.1 hypothetical protein GCM10012282_33180 [Streptomyces lacrimifluminis]
MKRRIAALVPALAAVAIAVPLSIATPAAAHASCGTTVSDKDSGSWGKRANGANERSGSSTSCTVKGIAYNTQTLDYHCWTVGNDDYTWTYLRNDSTGITGWVRDDLLSDGGSSVYCGF